MGSKTKYDVQSAADLLRQFKAIACKEIQMLPPHSVDSFFEDSDDESEEDRRARTISIGSADMVYGSPITPILSFAPSKSLKSFLLDDVKSNEDLEHHNWGSVQVSPHSIKKTATMEHPLLCSTNDIIKQCKKKKESFVGLTPKTSSVRATLRKKFSWKTYPELENFLLDNQDEYFPGTFVLRPI
ncbi:MAG: hypothetical protein SGARI_005752 [Bacillariaceae sp.]